MEHTTPCQQIRDEYDQLKTRKDEFVLASQQALKIGDLTKVKQFKSELEQKRDDLVDKFWPLENLPQQEFKKQYDSQKEMMERIGILEKLSSGELGIKAIDSQEYAFPTYQEITKMVRENKETLKLKTGQGFNQLLIVPFGLKLDDLIAKYKEVILVHHQAGKLLATKEKPSDPDETLELDESQPVYVWDQYSNADVDGKLVYDVQEFSTTNHQGKTKQEILRQAQHKQGAFNILLTEDLPNIPRQGKGKTIGGRPQLEAGQTPNQYLKTLQTNPLHQNESGMTPEDQLIYAILHLEKTNQVIDDYSGKGSASYQLGAYFPASGDVPDAYWRRGYRQASLDRYAPGASDSGGGARLAVRVKKLRI